MWERFNKLNIQVLIAVVSVVALNIMGLLLFFKEIPLGNKDIATYFVGQLQGAIVTGIFGWLYTASKVNKIAKDGE
jgi:hypothetical protein